MCLQYSPFAAVAHKYHGFQIQGAQIGVISLYRLQVTKLKEAINRMPTITTEDEERIVSGEDIHANTVDAFQGDEKDIIILSCVRSETTSAADFADSPNRINVALSRARFHLIIVGNPKTLSSSNLWKRVLLASRKTVSGYFPMLEASMKFIASLHLAQRSALGEDDASTDVQDMLFTDSDDNKTEA